MKKKLLSLLLAALFLVASTAALAGPGTATVTKKKVGWNKGTLYVIDWTSGTDAGVSTELAALAGDSSISGYLRYIQTIPGASGDKTTTVPDADYDIVLNDAYGYDIAAGNLANRSASAAERIIPSSPMFVDGTLTLVITNASNSKTGRLVLLVE